MAELYRRPAFDWRTQLNTTPTFVPVGSPVLSPLEIQYVTEALEAGGISGTHGKFLERFERSFADYCGCSHGIATSSGTTALHLAVASLGIGPGDEVLVSTLTNMATFFAVLYQGATPVPVDIEEGTLNLNPALLEGLLTSRTRAIVVVHLYGHPADMDPILEFARKHRLYVIEDAAEAHGALYKGRKVGSLGHIGCFSFYANKIMTTGEGGMLTTNESVISERARSLRGLGYGAKNKFMHSEIGFNYRMTNLQAALGCAQLERIEETIGGKRRMARLYNMQLADFRELQLPIEKPYARNVYWMYHVVLTKSLSRSRDCVMEALQQAGVETRPSFIPYNQQEIFIRKNQTSPMSCPVANRIADRGFYLPSSANLDEGTISYVAAQLKKALQESRG